MASPEDFLGQATKLLATAEQDFDYRGVITNAYYGAYHAALQFEESLPDRSKVTPKNVGSHEALIQRLEFPSPTLNYGLKILSQDIGAQLRMLKPLRETASYELDVTLRVDQAELAVASAKDILAECSKGRVKIKALASAPTKT